MTTMESPERWRHHGPMSVPGSGALNFDGLPVDVDALCRIVQGVLIHSDWLTAYGVDESQFRTVSRETLPLTDRLQQIADLDGSALTEERATDRRAVGTCRDYALMLCGMLRQQGVPARVGRSSYLVARRVRRGRRDRRPSGGAFGRTTPAVARE